MQNKKEGGAAPAASRLPRDIKKEDGLVRFRLTLARRQVSIWVRYRGDPMTVKEDSKEKPVSEEGGFFHVRRADLADFGPARNLYFRF